MIATNADRHRALHAGSFAAAAAVGVLVWFAARTFAADSCPAHDVLRVVSSCRALVGSLAVRVGVVAGAAVLLMELVSAGLLRTAETMHDERRAVERDTGSGVTSS